ncbi:MAG: hypothetical protein JO267_06980 [Alphaproteobacteria bacterium]|nr:hypothetical protein [Alphaproteobacteria bacterium]
MPDEQNEGNPAYLLPLQRIGERVAELGAHHQALKEDTGRIRTTMHDFANQMQALIGAERQCAQSLSALTAQVTSLTAQMTAMAGGLAAVTDSARAFTDMRDELRALIAQRHQREGISWTIAKAAAALAGLVAAAAGIVAIAPHIDFH